jgi:hypothetical protein
MTPKFAMQSQGKSLFSQYNHYAQGKCYEDRTWDEPYLPPLGFFIHPEMMARRFGLARGAKRSREDSSSTNPSESDDTTRGKKIKIEEGVERPWHSRGDEKCGPSDAWMEKHKQNDPATNTNNHGLSLAQVEVQLKAMARKKVKREALAAQMAQEERQDAEKVAELLAIKAELQAHAALIFTPPETDMRYSESPVIMEEEDAAGTHEREAVARSCPVIKRQE